MLAPICADIAHTSDLNITDLVKIGDVFADVVTGKY